VLYSTQRGKMTTIGAMQARENGEQFYVFFAEGMASNMHYDEHAKDIAGEKNDDYPKLRLAGNQLIAGAGVQHVMQDIFDMAQQKPATSAKALANQVAKAMQEQSTEGRTCNCTQATFIIGGPGGKSAELYHVVPMHEGYGAFKTNIVFDGGGEHYVQALHDSYHKIGVPLSMSLVDKVTHAYALSKEGARDLHSNDKFTLGITSAKGSAILYHPDIDLPLPEVVNYVNNGLGLRLPAPPKENSREIIDAGIILVNLYNCITTDIQMHHAATKAYQRFALDLRIAPVGKELLEAQLENYTQARQSLQQGIEALTSRNLQKIVTYCQQFNTRVSDAATRLERFA
jgi:hypothetical protein